MTIYRYKNRYKYPRHLLSPDIEMQEYLGKSMELVFFQECFPLKFVSNQVTTILRILIMSIEDNDKVILMTSMISKTENFLVISNMYKP